MEKARPRRRQVPAFGEWNYCTSSSSSSPHELPHSGAAVAECWWYAPKPEACSDAWFRYSPPPRRRPPAPIKKARRPETAVAAAAEQKCVATETTRARAGVRVPAKGAGRRAVVVVRPVDEDLYRVPPPDNDDTTVCRLPRRRKRSARRSLWMGCLGLNCVA